MFEKGLIIIIFMYIASFTFFGINYSVLQVFHIELTDWDGNPVMERIQNSTNIGLLNDVSTATIQTKFDIASATVAAINIAWQLFQLLTGTYIFNILLIVGVPQIFVIGFVTIYVILLMRAAIAYVRGI